MTKAKEVKFATEAPTELELTHPLRVQLETLTAQLHNEKLKLEAIEEDKRKINKAHSFLVGQNPNTPAGPKCMRLLESIESILKNQMNLISNVENMMAGCQGQLAFEEAASVINTMSKRYES